MRKTQIQGRKVILSAESLEGQAKEVDQYREENGVTSGVWEKVISDELEEMSQGRAVSALKVKWK